MSSNPYRPAATESYEDQLSEDPFRAGDDEQGEDSQANFLAVSSSSSSQQGGLIGSNNNNNNNTTSAAPDATSPLSFSDSLASGGAIKTGLLAFVSFLSVDYYRPYFDVSTRAVVQRIKNSMDPRINDVFSLPVFDEPAAAAVALQTEEDQAEAQQQPPPQPPSSPVGEYDLFGSVWISLTLIFLIGATSNFNAYLAAPAPSSPGASVVVGTDYTLLTLASVLVVVYTSVFPTLLWLALGWLGATTKPPLFKLLGLYGYLLSAFVIASLLCVIPVSAVQWVVVLLAGALSGVVLARNLTALVQFDSPPDTAAAEVDAPAAPTQKFKPVLATALAAHVVFTMLIKLYFFQGAEVKI